MRLEGSRRWALSDASRALTWLAAVLFALVGVIFFLAPGWSAERFPWSVTPFVAMTIGGWSLGTAAIAFEAARIWHFPRVYPMLVYLWAFGLLELGVVLAFRERLQTGNLLTYPYLAALLVTALAAVVGVIDLVRRRPAVRDEAVEIPTWVRLLTFGFIIVLAVLWIRTLVLPPGTGAVSGGIFPEPLTPFTFRAFGAFFLAIDLAALSLLLSRDLRTYLDFARVGLFLVVPITIASFVYIHLFDFGGRPGGLIYIGAYLLTFALAAFALLRYARSRRVA